MARIGHRSPACDRLLARLGGRTGGFVTAWNPFSQRRPEKWNRRRQAALLTAARRLPIAHGRGSAPERGQGGSWSEEHLLIAADPRRIAVLGRRFGQHAIVVVARGQPARLRLLPQRGPRSHF